MMSIKSVSRFIFFLTCEYPVAPAPSVEKTVYCIVLPSFSCQISVDHIYWGGGQNPESISGL